MLEKLDDQRERIILEERYWNGKSWDDIMEELHFERSQSFRMHNSALVHLYELIHSDD